MTPLMTVCVRGGGGALSRKIRYMSHRPFLRKAPRAVWRLLTSFSFPLVNCMCCLLCCRLTHQHHHTSQQLTWHRREGGVRLYRPQGGQGGVPWTPPPPFHRRPFLHSPGALKGPLMRGLVRYPCALSLDPPPRLKERSPCQEHDPADAHPQRAQVSAGVGKPPHGLGVCIGMPLVNSTGNSPVSGTAVPRVVKQQDKSSGGSGDTTKTRSGPQRVRMSSGERPIGTAKGKQSDTEALCQPPPRLCIGGGDGPPYPADWNSDVGAPS